MRHICPLGCVKCFDGRFACKMSDCTSDAGCMRSRGPVLTATATATAWITSSAAAVLCAQKCTITLNPSQRQRRRRGWDETRKHASKPAPHTGSHKSHLNLTPEDTHFHLFNFKVHVQFLVIGFKPSSKSVKVKVWKWKCESESTSNELCTTGKHIDASPMRWERFVSQATQREAK